MVKRVVVLTLAILAGWLLWDFLRRRMNEFLDATPQPASLPASRPLAVPVAPPPPEIVESALESVPDVAERDEVELALVEAAIAGETVPDERETPDEADESDAEALEGVEGYCMHCRAKRTIQDAHEEVSENGRRMARGTCPVCGTTIVRFLKDVQEA